MRFTLWLLMIFVSGGAAGQSKTAPGKAFTKDAIAEIDAVFKQFDRKDSPGFGIGIIRGDKVLYTRGYGSANLDYNIPITPDSSFDIASVSKQFTAACIALLILDGKITLDTPVSNFVPEIAKYKDTIRIKHLIYNTSGITDYYKLPRPDGRSWITFNYFDIDYCIKISLTPDTLAFKPEEKWDYCNVNFMLLTKIVEKVSGQPFRDFAKERLFLPLGMNNTFINDDVTQIIKNRVTPYNVRSKEYVNAYRFEGINVNDEGEYMQHSRNSPHYGGSGVVTTVNDIMKWSANFYIKKFGGQPFYDLMHTTQNFKNGRNNQAFGLYLDSYKGRPFAAWDGGDYGISSQILRFTEGQNTIVVFSNLGSGEAFGKANVIADILIKYGYL
jgi:CubicO group peptidase (beta-lactamase class C family)